MNMQRSWFAFTHMANRTVITTLTILISAAVLELGVMPFLKPHIAGILRVSSAGACLLYYAYWTRFYYAMYNVSELQIPNSNANWFKSAPWRAYYLLELGHRSAFERRAAITLGAEVKEEYKEYRNAILYPGDILVVAKSGETYKEIESALRADRVKRGIRYNNNLPFGEGTFGFITSDKGVFHNHVKNSRKPAEIIAST